MLFNDHALLQSRLPDLSQFRAAYRSDIDSKSDCLPDQAGTDVEHVGYEVILTAVDSTSVPVVPAQLGIAV
jgi:hypothetical protein